MIRHIVLLRLHEGVAATDPRVVAACAAEEDLAAQAPGGHGWRFARDLSRRPVSADFVGTGDFASAGELAEFLAHPAHSSVLAHWAPLATCWVADLEVEP